jgi:hypothetical protein
VYKVAIEKVHQDIVALTTDADFADIAEDN